MNEHTNDARCVTTEEKRKARQITEREIGIALVLELAESGLPSFSLLGFYLGICAESPGVQAGDE
jgi:hypothetical protein